MATLAGDLICMWAAVGALCFGLALTSAASIQDNVTTIVGCLLPVALVIAAIVVTVLQMTGVLGLW